MDAKTLSTRQKFYLNSVPEPFLLVFENLINLDHLVCTIHLKYSNFACKRNFSQILFMHAVTYILICISLMRCEICSAQWGCAWSVVDGEWKETENYDL